MSQQKSISSFFAPTTEPLRVTPRPPKPATAPAQKRKVGRPRKVVPTVTPAPLVLPSTPVSAAVVPESAPEPARVVLPSTPVSAPVEPPVPAGPSTSTQGSASRINTRYSAAQKKKVAQYARFHGGRAASKHFNIHHKNVQRWLKEELDTVKHPRRAKRCNKKGQGRKLSYPAEIDMQLLQWVLELREEKQLPVSSHEIKVKALSLIKPLQPDFKASDGWVKAFMRRHNLVFRAKTSIAQELPKELKLANSGGRSSM